MIPRRSLTAYPNLELIRCDVDLAVMDFESKDTCPKRIQDLFCTRCSPSSFTYPHLVWEAVREVLKEG